MARETVEYPTGVSQSVFDTHTHNYRKLTQIGADGTGSYTSPVRTYITDDSEVTVTDSNKVTVVGVTVATEPTEVPN